MNKKKNNSSTGKPKNKIKTFKSNNAINKSSKEGSDRYRTLFDQSPDGIVIIDPKTARFIDFNAAAHCQLGYTRKEFSQLSILDIEAAETAQQTKTHIKDVIKHGKAEFETLQRTKKGDIRNILVTAQYITVQGQPVYQCFWRDITGLKQAEKKVLENESRVTSIIDTAMDGFCIINDKGQILSVNDAYCNMSGYSRAELLKMTIADIEVRYSPKETGNVINTIIRNGTARFETLHRRKDGSVFNIEVSAQRTAFGQNTIFAFLRDITGHKWVEEELRESQQRLSRIIDFLPDATLVIDRTGKVIAWNRAIEEMTGVKSEQMLGKGDHEYALPFYGIRRPILIDLVFRSDEEIKNQYSYVKKEGDVLIAETNKTMNGRRTLWGKAVPLYDNNGKIVAAIEGIRDITELRQAEKDLRETKQKLESTLNALPDLLFEIDVNGIIFDYRAPETSELYVPPEQFLGKSVYDILPANAGEKIRACVKAAQRNEVCTDSNYSLPISGEVRWYELSISRTKTEMGKETERFIALARDITKRKQAEEALADRLIFQQALIDSIPYPIFTKDSNGRFVGCNRAYEQVFGTTRAYMLGKTVLDLEYLPVEERRRFQTEDMKVINQVSRSSYEMPIVYADGKTHITLYSVDGFRLADGKPGGLIGMLVDITERKNTEQELLELNRTLEEKVTRTVSELREKDQMIILQSRQAAMGEMLGNIAHQWRQPLNAIGILVQNLMEHEKAGQLDRAYLEKTVIKTMDLILHMSRTIDDFRNFFKTDKERTMFSLKSVVEKALSFVSASYADHGINSQLICDEDISVSGYPNEFSQALLNIFNNALEIFKERLTVNPRVTACIRRENKHTKITITDNAGGIPSGILNKIFEPFFTTKEMGTGIGLYMAKTIIEKNMGGKLVARNTDDGAEFLIEL